MGKMTFNEALEHLGEDRPVRMNKITAGKCTHCRVIWEWTGNARLKDSLCPRCRTQLKPTTRLSKLPRLDFGHRTRKGK